MNDMSLKATVMNARWNNYAKLMPYASEISFNETIDALRNLRFY